MYLAKIELNQRYESVRQALRDCGDMHRNVQRLFDAGRSDAGVLYRNGNEKNGCYLYVLSETLPTESEATQKNGMKIVGLRDVSALENVFVPGKVLHFDLLTMPCKKQWDGASKNSRRVVLRKAEERIGWLRKKAVDNGFEILDALETEQVVMFANKKEGRVYLHPYQYEGVLRITDEAKFKTAWKNGIGPEKAYGLGMLMVR